MEVESCRKIVKWLLENEIEARDDIHLLIALTDVKTNDRVRGLKYEDVMKKRRELKLYSIESISRARRLIVEQHPELRGHNEAEIRRAEKEEEYRQYCREEKKRE